MLKKGKGLKEETLPAPILKSREEIEDFTIVKSEAYLKCAKL